MTNSEQDQHIVQFSATGLNALVCVNLGDRLCLRHRYNKWNEQRCRWIQHVH